MKRVVSLLFCVMFWSASPLSAGAFQRGELQTSDLEDVADVGVRAVTLLVFSPSVGTALSMCVRFVAEWWQDRSSAVPRPLPVRLPASTRFELDAEQASNLRRFLLAFLPERSIEKIQTVGRLNPATIKAAQQNRPYSETEVSFMNAISVVEEGVSFLRFAMAWDFDIKAIKQSFCVDFTMASKGRYMARVDRENVFFSGKIKDVFLKAHRNVPVGVFSPLIHSMSFVEVHGKMTLQMLSDESIYDMPSIITVPVCTTTAVLTDLMQNQRLCGSVNWLRGQEAVEKEFFAKV